MAKLYHADDAYIAKLKSMLDGVKELGALHKIIVDAPFHDKKQTTLLGLGMLVLTMVNHREKTVDRIAYSDTEAARSAFSMSVKPFKDLKVPLADEYNIVARATRTNHPQITDDWRFLFTPVLTPEEARFIQAGAGTDCSVVCPLPSDEVLGALIFSYYEPPQSIGSGHRAFMRSYSAMAAEALSRTA